MRTSMMSLSHVLPGDGAPGARISNAILTELMGEVRDRIRAAGRDGGFLLSTPDFPESRIGIRHRCILDRSWTARDLAVEAARRCLQRSEIPRTRVRGVIVSTVTPDKVVPPLATTVQAALGLDPDIAVYDLHLGCNGFMAALDLATRLLTAAPEGEAVLIVSAEVMSRVLDAADRDTCAIFGDGAGAALVVRTGEDNIDPVQSGVFGDRGAMIEIAPKGPDKPLYRFTVSEGEPAVRKDEDSSVAVRMAGRRVFRDMCRIIPEQIDRYWRRSGIDDTEIDHYAFHQANRRMIEAIASDERLSLRPEKLLFNIQDVGNTTSASIPVLLSQARDAGTIGPGSRVLLVGFGTGYSVGINLVRF